MISLAGHYISPLVSKVADFIGQYISPRDVLQFDPTAWNHNLYHLAPAGSIQPPAISIGTLTWPQGASRFATCYLLASDADMEILRPLLFTDEGPQAVTLIMNDAQTDRETGLPIPTDNEIETEMFALPPRPLQQITGENCLWLLTLVDERYFWWFRGSDIVVDVGTDDYNDLISQIAMALGITIDADTVNSNYGDPSNRFTNRRCPLPMLLDAVCFYSGLRFSRALDGTNYANTYASDATRSEANTTQIGYNSANWKPLAGGDFNSGDITQSVPDTVQVVIGRTDDGVYSQAPYVADTTLLGLGLAAYSGVTGFNGKKVLTGDLVAIYVAASLTNTTAIDDYVEQMSKDWYLWQLGDQDRSMSRIVPWDPTGLDGTVQWTHSASNQMTRVMRDTFNQMDWGRFRRSDKEGERSWIYDYVTGDDLDCTAVEDCLYGEEADTTEIEVGKVCLTKGVLTFTTADGYVDDVLLDGVSILGLSTDVIISGENQKSTIKVPTVSIVTPQVCVDVTTEDCCFGDCCYTDADEMPSTLTLTCPGILVSTMTLNRSSPDSCAAPGGSWWGKTNIGDDIDPVWVYFIVRLNCVEGESCVYINGVILFTNESSYPGSLTGENPLSGLCDPVDLTQEYTEISVFTWDDDTEDDPEVLSFEIVE